MPTSETPHGYGVRGREYICLAVLVLFAYTISRDEVKSGKHSHGFASYNTTLTTECVTGCCHWCFTTRFSLFFFAILRFTRPQYCFFCLQHLLNTISSFSQDFHRCSNTASQSASMQWKPVEIPSQTVLHKSLCHRINFLSLFFPFKDFELPLQTAFNPFPMSPSSSLNLQE